MTYRAKQQEDYELLDPDMQWLTVEQMAQRLQVSEATVRRYVNAGDWPHWRQGKVVRFTVEDIERIEQIGHREPVPRKRRVSLQERRAKGALGVRQQPKTPVAGPDQREGA